jgi:Flp pilus assembly protein TadG
VKDKRVQSMSLLARLRRDQRGGTLAILAASIVPIAGMVGSGIDMSRAYMAKSRLQQACDAGVLAGRKVMSTSVDATVTAEVRKFVNFDFPQGSVGTSAFTIDPTLGTNNSVDLTLTTRIPTSIMKIFGFTSLPISASCTARQDFVNTDVMLVLDTTLSMNCLPSESASTYCTSEKSGSKIQALRAGVLSLYQSLKAPQNQLEAAGLRLRYGIVPYSLTVNTGKLVYALDPTYIQSSSAYKQCTSSSNNGTYTVCNTAVTSNPLIAHSATWLGSSSWGGCIEERATVSTINANSGYSIPTNATDLDVDSAPTGLASSKWAPYDPAAATAKAGLAGINFACPRAASLMTRFAAESDITSWLSTMTAGGYTYHDIGLIWGARLMSSNGMWASNNPTNYANFPVVKHLIFMTDGAMDPDVETYSAYGVEKFDRRVSGNGNATTQLDSHTQRFRMMCNKIKSMDVSIWVIAFGSSAGTGLSQELINCASAPNQAFKADDQATLNARFKEIGESIGALRLSR